MLRASLQLGVYGVAVALAGCTLPRSGPSMASFNQANHTRQIELIEVSDRDADASRDPALAQFPSAWKTPGPINFDRLGRGDVLAVTLYESDDLGVFTPPNTGVAKLDQTLVDGNGYIQLPYVGNVYVDGLTIREVREALVKRLRALAYGADAQISIVERHSQVVSVEGDVAKPVALQLTPDITHLSALLTLAAPTPANLEQATVTVQRGSTVATVRMSDIFEQPDEDVLLEPGDRVVVRNASEMVNVIGAAGTPGRVRLTKRNYSVLDAVSDAHGLGDDEADPAAVYLMRASDKTVLVPEEAKIYHFNLRNPAQLALASRFTVHNGDAIFISDASYAQTRKLFAVFSGAVDSSRLGVAVAP